MNEWPYRGRMPCCDKKLYSETRGELDYEFCVHDGHGNVNVRLWAERQVRMKIAAERRAAVQESAQ